MARLTPDSAESIDQVLVAAGPLAESSTDALARQNHRPVEHLSESSPLLSRQSLNSSMGSQTPADNGGRASSDASPVEVGSSQTDMAKTVLRKIDRTIIPLLFVTYMFNFMDKIILSSAAVFGLREDNVSRHYSDILTMSVPDSQTNKMDRTSKDKNTAGSAASSTLAT